MALAPVNAPAIGCITEAQYRNRFEYAWNPNPVKALPANGAKHPWNKRSFEHLIYVGPCGETRMALILDTVAHVIVDEDENGEWVVERWKLTGHRKYHHK